MTRNSGHPVHWWPGALPQARGGLLVVGIGVDSQECGPRLRADDRTGDDRVPARARIRAALRGALAQLAGLPDGDIVIHSEPGRAPTVSFPGAAAIPAPGLAISHDGDISLAAINLSGPVGIDLMRVQEIPDWQAVAHDYLGPDVAAMLAAAAPGLRAAAFARAWTGREARLKCHGLPLAEWTPDAGAQTAACRCAALALPDGFVGTLAWR